MTWWLILALIAAIAGATYTFCDNYITDVFFKGNLPQAQKAFFGPAYIATAIIVFLLFGIGDIEFSNALWLIFAGMLSTASLIPYYIALGKDEATNVTIYEQLSPVFYLILGCLLLGETITGRQFIGLAIIFLAPLSIILSARKRSQKTQIRTAILIIIRVIVSSVANILLVKFGRDVDFITLLIFVMFGKGIFDSILCLVVRPWRKRFDYVLKHTPKKQFFGVMTADHFVYLLSDFTYYGSLVLAPVAAMTAAVSKTVQPIAVFVFGLVLTIIWPSFGREKLNRRTVRAHFIAIILAVIGIFMIQ